MPNTPDPHEHADDMPYPRPARQLKAVSNSEGRTIRWNQLMFICSLDVWLAVDDITDCRMEPHPALLDEIAWLDADDCRRFQRQLTPAPFWHRGAGDGHLYPAGVNPIGYLGE